MAMLMIECPKCGHIDKAKQEVELVDGLKLEDLME